MKKSISMLTMINRSMIQYDVDEPSDWFRREVNWMLAIHEQLPTLFALDLDRVHHLLYTLLLQKYTYSFQKGIKKFQTLCSGLKTVEIIMHC
jgi:hypothetical protein